MGFSLKAMWTNKCPRCHHGSIFSKPMEIFNPLKMPKQCELCNQVTEPEPGFYYGAMFVSYITNIWFLMVPALLLLLYFDWSAKNTMLFIFALGAATYLKFLRGSRSLWFHMMVKHDPKIEEMVKIKLNKNQHKS